jgi:hypothetical protein
VCRASNPEYGNCPDAIEAANWNKPKPKQTAMTVQRRGVIESLGFKGDFMLAE